MQTAARRVLDENRRLRALLCERGVSESEIDSYHNTDFFNTSSSLPIASSGPSATLESMLQTSTPSLAAACDPVQWDTTQQQSQPLLSAPIPQRPIQHQRAVELQQQRYSPRDSTPRSNVSPVSTTESISSYSQLPSTPPEEDHTEPGTFPHLTYQYDLAPHSPWPMAPPRQVENTQNQGNCAGSTSCAYAVNIISDGTMNHQLASDMHCQQYSTAADCPVPNMILFDVMDRYHHPRP